MYEQNTDGLEYMKEGKPNLVPTFICARIKYLFGYTIYRTHLKNQVITALVSINEGELNEYSIADHWW